jgi:hypothetical protein
VCALDFKQLVSDISWDEVTLMNQFQYGLHNNVKDLLLTMLDPSTLSQAIDQVVCCNNKFFEYRQKKHWELPIIPKNFAPIMPSPPTTSTLKDDIMQID